MNNNANFPNKYNYQTNMQQQSLNKNMNSDLFTPYEGFIRGNMYRNLYDPYKQYKAYQIQPMNEQAEMLTNLDSLGFALIDLDLYLDVYPNDKSKIELFNQYRTQKENLLRQYENQYGPIVLSSDAMNTYPWAWDDRPWPWEN